MNKIEKMIKEMCPNGVEYKALGEISNICRGASPRPISRFLTEDNSGINWVKIGDVEIGAKYITSTREKITKEGSEHSRKVKPCDFILSNSMSFGRPYIMKIDGCIHDGWLSISDFDRYLLSDFLYYVLMSSGVQKDMKQRVSFGGIVENLNSDIVKKITIPVPPIEIQREIVRILDNFTSLTAELTARNKQYEYYRDKLLNEGVSENSSGDDKNSRDKDKTCRGEASRARKYKLGEIGKFYGGLSGKSKEDFKDGNEKYITYMNVFMNSSIDININDKVKILSNEKQNIVEYGDIIFTGSSETQNECGMSSVLVNEVDEKLYLNSFCFGYRLNDKNLLLPQYAKYLFRSSLVRKQIIKTASGVTRFNVSKAKMENVEIYIPDIIIQKKIAGVLDNFESICKDLNIGLPAEIDARKKQYEYYRDSLLKFAETGNVDFVERENHSIS